jgi:hypothetical protein
VVIAYKVSVIFDLKKVFTIDNIFGGIFYQELIAVVHFCSPFDKIRGNCHPVTKLKERYHEFGAS